MISDLERRNQLYSFLVSVPLVWKWDELAELEGEHVEDRGPESRPMQFSLQLLERDSKEGKSYLHLIVAVSDPGRGKPVLGSAWLPLSTSFLWFQDGTLDMPTAQ